MPHQYLLEQDGNRQHVGEWTYLAAMATGSYEHVISTESVTVYRRWRWI
jgi:hypothetical protein